MAEIPWILNAAVASEALPIVAGLIKPARLRGPRGLIAAWCAVILLANLVARWLGSQGINNHFIVYIITPIQGALILWALSLWQIKPVPRLTLRLAILPFLIAIGLLSLLEDTSNFSTVAEPVYCLLALLGCLYTLVVRSQESNEPLTRQDWFWICSSLAILFGMTAVLTPLGAAMMRDHVDIVLRAYLVKGYVTVAVFLLVTVGMLCPPDSGPRP